jgi:ribose-phosphate pyrophosphokinase
VITLNGYKITPTFFPDGTQQVWKLPEELARTTKYLELDWRFENEAELITVMQVRKLFSRKYMSLYMPYMPYARQDKEVTNQTTFALSAFVDFINTLDFDVVVAFDVHNVAAASKIKSFTNITPMAYHQRLIRDLNPEWLVFPDAGARERYSDYGRPYLVFEKYRDQLTGEITGHRLVNTVDIAKNRHVSFLILDDICDGGATFLSVAKAIRELTPATQISLFVSHGIFSKGRSHLEREGISLYTTDSLPRNFCDFIV